MTSRGISASFRINRGVNLTGSKPACLNLAIIQLIFSEEFFPVILEFNNISAIPWHNNAFNSCKIKTRIFTNKRSNTIISSFHAYLSDCFRFRKLNGKFRFKSLLFRKTSSWIPPQKFGLYVEISRSVSWIPTPALALASAFAFRRNGPG